MNINDFFDRFHIVVEMPPAPDCRFVGSWLLKVAEVASLVSQMRANHTFARLVSNMATEPTIEAAALEVVSALRHDPVWAFHATNPNIALAIEIGDLTGNFGTEFAILLECGFFVLKDGRYQMSVPEPVTPQVALEAVRKVASTDVEQAGPEPRLILHTMPKARAEAMALQLRDAT
ncbi:hypothetical protein QCM80_02490 [Bradyrhizobium sp. SSUT112]|uniref:hypothetical protein n=1 Tax=Bradyrhizobium sp. SSUT112 TaxID=3040604 RepID=UPI00244D5122|nr:hypothetical protein [Bradyrhizobium sp. SSUT112]MDH2349552.1 hypothetical protein [Bradyrhizobium sp. SSUT112]